jgi:hypothetical protein
MLMIVLNALPCWSRWSRFGFTGSELRLGDSEAVKVARRLAGQGD